MASPTASARHPWARRASSSPRRNASRSPRVARIVVSMPRSRLSWLIQADTSVTAGRRSRSTSPAGGRRWSSLRHRRGRSRTAVEDLGRRRRRGGGGRRGPGPGAGPRRRSAASGRCRPGRGRAARSGRAGRPRPARRSRQAPTAWATPTALPRSDRASLTRHHDSSGSFGTSERRRSCSHSSSAQPRRPLRVEPRGAAGRRAAAGGRRRRRRRSGRRRRGGGAASRSAGRPWAATMPSSPCSSDASDGVP